ncbi:HXXXD-type acyl-transferase family protein [Euphorbia peplus]|nr:HXXXD-type acyl-transferase family protein [Euphorbia peplus]
MDVSVVSIDTIRPSSSHVHHLQPFNLCLLDQLTPTTYSPFIFFYNTKDFHLTFAEIIPQLKCSLSKTLNVFYPLSGRVKDNLVIDQFDAGVPWFVARVNGHLSCFLQHPRMEMLNRFLPYHNCYGQLDPTVPILVVQVNVFDCGGIALGLCGSHKIMDAITSYSFMKTWAANSSGSYKNLMQVQPNLFEASVMFPPRKSLPSGYTSLINGSLWFGENVCRTRRFVFDANAIATLRTKGRSELVENPTRVEALSAFIWKHALKACEKASGFLRPSFLYHSVNIRRLMKPEMSRYSIGNLVMHAVVRYSPSETEIEMKELVSLVREGVGKFNSEYLKNMCGDEGFEAILRHLDHDFEQFSMENHNPHVFDFSSWNSIGIDDIDFGWGKPVWIGSSGEISCAKNHILFKDPGRTRNGSIEAWMALDESIMKLLEHDTEFLAFASSNPSVTMTHVTPSSNTYGNFHSRM